MCAIVSTQPAVDVHFSRIEPSVGPSNSQDPVVVGEPDDMNQLGILLERIHTLQENQNQIAEKHAEDVRRIEDYLTDLNKKMRGATQTLSQAVNTM